MEWHPVLDVASRDLAGDAALLREVLADLGRQAGAAGGWRLDAEARLAAGWWFYTVHATPAYAGALAARFGDGPGDGRGAAGAVSRAMDSRGSGARIKPHGDVPALAGYWSWLLR